MLVLSIFNERGPDVICQQRSVIVGYWVFRARTNAKRWRLFSRARFSLLHAAKLVDPTPNRRQS
ncbi:MAG: hypothetical protein DME48_07935 [Verrucomicrobia bacterium]|nr:MAG: hypothetical protein DME48_07935 [Verrucomicrobiota bacterium]